MKSISYDIRCGACPRFGQYAKRAAAPRRSFTRRDANCGDTLGFESLARRFESCGLPGEILPTRHGDVDISRMKLDRVAAAAGHFRRDYRGA